MAENFDTNAYYHKLANNLPVSEDEIVALLKAVNAYQAGVAWLASCAAATLEDLPKSASKSARRRHIAIVRAASDLLDGHTDSVKFPSSPDAAQNRCQRALAAPENLEV
ncbi:hypothetical protein [Paraburkholderia sp. A3RO-2L]|uniref:hypothetical protein n=1 Tax=unclassified Paraburkholderia TaxID=2615204 RepID=UPI0032F222E5|nr:hypothetical protein [Burkholderia vietnamiensis]